MPQKSDTASCRLPSCLLPGIAVFAPAQTPKTFLPKIAVFIMPNERRSLELPLMGWSGRAPAPPASEAGKGRQRQGAHAMSQTPNTAIAVIGIDIGKNSFHVVGHDARGAIVLRQK